MSAGHAAPHKHATKSYEDIAAEVVAELRRLKGKHPDWPTDPVHALALIQEELGEAFWEVVNATYKQPGIELDAAYVEVLQVAAVAICWLANFYKYVIRPSERVVGDGA